MVEVEVLNGWVQEIGYPEDHRGEVAHRVAGQEKYGHAPQSDDRRLKPERGTDVVPYPVDGRQGVKDKFGVIAETMQTPYGNKGGFNLTHQPEGLVKDAEIKGLGTKGPVIVSDIGTDDADVDENG